MFALRWNSRSKVLFDGNDDLWSFAIKWKQIVLIKCREKWKNSIYLKPSAQWLLPRHYIAPSDYITHSFYVHIDWIFSLANSSLLHIKFACSGKFVKQKHLKKPWRTSNSFTRKTKCSYQLWVVVIGCKIEWNKLIRKMFLCF